MGLWSVIVSVSRGKPSSSSECGSWKMHMGGREREWKILRTTQNHTKKIRTMGKKNVRRVHSVENRSELVGACELTAGNALV